MEPQLYKAATEGNVLILKQLIQENAGVLTSVTPQHNTALHIAARRGHKNFAEEILKVNVTLLRMKNIDEDTPLHIAAKAGTLDIVKTLINYTASLPPDIESDVKPLRISNKLLNTPLHEAVENRYSEIAMELLKAEREAGHMLNNKKETPLDIASREGLKDVVSEILKNLKGAVREEEVPPLPGTGSPLHQAVLGGHFDIVDLLLESGMDFVKVVDQFGSSALHCAAQKNNGKMVEMLLRKESSLAYLPNQEGQSPLHVAAANNSSSAIREILKLCPDAAEQVDKSGRNAVHIAVMSGTIAALKCLLKSIEPQEIINQADNDGNTPLHLAAKNTRIQSTRLLLKDKRVNPCILNNEGRTARGMIESVETYEMYLWQSLKESEERKCNKQRQVPELSMSRKPFKKKMSTTDEHFKSCVESYTLVAALIATVTFAAIFTMPGGYSQDHGYALLAKRAAFKVFVISNTIATCSSLIVVFCFIWAWKNPVRFKFKQLIWGHRLIVVASLAMLVALMTAVYVAVDTQCKWVAIVVCFICCSAPFVLWAILGHDILFVPL